MRRFSIIDIIISIGTVFLVVATLVPAVARLQRTPEDAKCQSNMRRFAEAVALYANDYDRRYPTNRVVMGFKTHTILLSPRKYDENGNLIRFVYGINWVEALYPYMMDEARKTGRDWESFLACPKAGNVKFPPSSGTASVSYVFNYNLLEFSPGIIRDQAKMMMMREMDRLVEATCRPCNNSTGTSSVAPLSPFLIKSDFLMRGVAINDKPHGEGSHILFADGHVKYFSSEYFPQNMSLSPSYHFDVETGQWWNYVNLGSPVDKAIAITP